MLIPFHTGQRGDGWIPFGDGRSWLTLFDPHNTLEENLAASGFTVLILIIKGGGENRAGRMSSPRVQKLTLREHISVCRKLTNM